MADRTIWHDRTAMATVKYMFTEHRLPKPRVAFLGARKERPELEPESYELMVDILDRREKMLESLLEETRKDKAKAKAKLL